MTNAVYPLWKQALMTEAQANKGLDSAVAATAPYAVLVDPTIYTYSAAHQFYTDLTGVLGTPVQIVSPTVANGLFTGGNVLFSNISGHAGAFVVFRQNAGANTTWRLVMYQDTGIVGFPMTASGGNIVLRWDAAGIFQL